MFSSSLSGLSALSTASSFLWRGSETGGYYHGFHFIPDELSQEIRVSEGLSRGAIQSD